MLISKRCVPTTLCSGRVFFFFAAEVGTSVEQRQVLLSVSFLWELEILFFFSCSYREGNEEERGCFMLQRQSSGVTDRWEEEERRGSPPSVVESESKKAADSSTLRASPLSISTPT